MRASPQQFAFNAGEFSPRLEGRQDIAKYGSACRILEGFIPLVQGPAMRRGGTPHLGEVKDSTRRTWLVPFAFNTQQAYMLEFGHQYIRFWANRGQVLSGATPYEIASPYTESDLTDSEGQFQLRIVESADVLYIAHGSYAPRKLSRLGPTNWTLTTITPAGGPFQDTNITATTVYASAATGSVTLTASAAIFQAGHVGGVFYIAQKSVLDIKPWYAGQTIGAIGTLRHSDGKNYAALNTGTTGGDKPTHTSGARYDGDTGVQWQFSDPGWGAVLITGYTDSQHVTGTVVSVYPTSDATPQLPSNCVGAGNPTTRWALPAWSDVDGWPTQVAFFRQRLCFGRKQTVWLSVAGDYETFTAKDQSGTAADDMAITRDLLSSHVNDLQWMESVSAGVDALICGTAGAEFAIKSMTENAPFGTKNVTGAEVSALGSRNTPPVRVGAVLLFAQRAGLKLRDVTYDSIGGAFQSVDQTLLAEHVLRPSVLQLAYQQEPYSIVWARRSDGILAAMTYSREQYPEAPHGGWHRQPVGGSGFVESIAVIPTPDGARDELWAIVRRTINGATRRYVEIFAAELQDTEDPEDAFYVDSGLTLDNTQAATLSPPVEAMTAHATGAGFKADADTFVAGDVGRSIHHRYSVTADDGTVTFATAKALITSVVDARTVVCTIDAAFPSDDPIPGSGWRLTVTTISGLGHLEGQTVDVLADGASHPQRAVSGGSITLQRPAGKVHVGLPQPARLKPMRPKDGAADGTSQGKKGRINQLVVRLHRTGALRYGRTFDDMFDVDFRTALDPMDNPAPLFTGDVLLDFPGDYSTDPAMCFDLAHPLPCTIVALMPQLTTEDRG